MNRFHSGRPRSRPAGRQKPPITKYYRSGQSDSTSTDTNRRTRQIVAAVFKRWLRRFASLALLAAILLAVVYSLLVSPQPKVESNSTAYRPLTAYQQASSDLLNSFKNRNKVSLDEQGIADQLQTKFPEIITVSTELPLFGQQPLIHIRVAEPAVYLNSAGRTFIIDSQGRAVAEAYQLPQIKGLPTLNDQSGFAVTNGSRVLNAPTVTFIGQLIAQTKQAKIPLSSLVLPSAPQQLHIRIADQPYYVKFYLGGDPLQQIGQFIAARNRFNTTGVGPTEYLDVRVQGRVFYK